MMRFLALLPLIALLAGCGPKQAAQSASLEGKITIVATTGMVADVARNVAGERATVTALMGPGVDPHLYKASPGDVSQLQGADIILYSGLFLEGKMIEVFESLSRSKPVVPVTATVPRDRLLETTAFGGHPDPHVWFDVSLWAHTADVVADELAKYDPAGADTYKANAEKYKSDLTILHTEVQSALQAVPPEKRVLITAHDAFGYFGRAYGLEVLGIQGISTESEAGLKEINRLIDVIVQRKVRAVFVESSVSQKNVEALVEGAKRRGANVRVGGQLFSDAMGNEGTPEGTYIGMVRHNVRTIVEALK